jgi:hypothetical protein
MLCHAVTTGLLQRADFAVLLLVRYVAATWFVAVSLDDH